MSLKKLNFSIEERCMKETIKIAKLLDENGFNEFEVQTIGFYLFNLSPNHLFAGTGSEFRKK